MTAIGLYLVRCSDSGASVTLAHLVESEIADRVVTNCGHQMERRNRRGSLRTAGPLDGECSFCPPRAAARTDIEERPPESVREIDGGSSGDRVKRPADYSGNIPDRVSDIPEPVASEQDDS